MTGLYLEDANATDSFAALLGAQIQSLVPKPFGTITIALEGELGAGKSHLARGLLRAIGVSGAIPSPTYSLLETYPDAHPAAAHMDWYRLGDAMELEMLDWDAVNRDFSVILVEWASRIPDMDAQMDLRIELRSEKDGRSLEMKPRTPVAKGLVSKIDPILKEMRTGQ